MNYLITALCGIGLLIYSILLGSAIVYGFNHLPMKLAVDVGERPMEENRKLADVSCKYTMPAVFIILTFGMWIKWGLPLAIAGSVYMWPMILIAITDYYYKVIHEKLIAVAILGNLALIPFTEGVSTKWRFLVPVVIFAIINGIGYLLYKKMAFGGGDLMLLVVMCISLTGTAVLLIFLASVFLTVLHYILSKILQGTMKFNVSSDGFVPMAPYLVTAMAIYMVFFFRVPLYDIIIGL